MAEELTDKVIAALINRSYEETRESLHRLNAIRSSFGSGVFSLVEAVNQRLFEDEDLLHYSVPNLLRDSVDREKGPTKMERYKALVHFLTNPVNYLTSNPAEIVLSNLPFLRDGVEINIWDSEGNPIRFSTDYVRGNVLKIVDDFEGLSRYLVNYVRGMRDGFKIAKSGPLAGYEEGIDLETFVRDDRAELYAMLRMLSNKTDPMDLTLSQDVLKERFFEFSRRYITGPDNSPGEYSYVMNVPFDFLLTTAKAMVHIVGDSKHWSSIIRFYFQPKSFIHDIVEKLDKHMDVGEELRKGTHKLGETLYKMLEEVIRLSKEYLNLTGKRIFDRQMHVINTMGERDYQRKIVGRYSLKHNMK